MVLTALRHLCHLQVVIVFGNWVHCSSGSLKDIILSRNDPKRFGSPGMYLANCEESNSRTVFSKFLHGST